MTPMLWVLTQQFGTALAALCVAVLYWRTGHGIAWTGAVALIGLCDLGIRAAIMTGYALGVARIAYAPLWLEGVTLAALVVLVAKPWPNRRRRDVAARP